MPFLLFCIQAGYAQRVELTINAYEEINWSTTKYYKANLHTHTRVSDGDLRPHEAVDQYYQTGYHILSLTDHIPSWDGNNPDNILTWPWTGFSGLTSAVQHDASWQDRDPDELGMLAVQGSEQSEGHHRGSYFTNISDPGGDLHSSFQTITEQDGLAILFHPGQYWNLNNVYNPGQTYSPEWYQDFFDRYDILVGLEVYNSGNKHPNDRVLWDEILMRMMPERPVWGYSNDDMHHDFQLFKNYQYMLMDTLSEGELRNAMRRGQLFFSYEAAGMGDALAPVIDSLTVCTENEIIEIHATDFHTIEWISGITGQGSSRESRIVSTGEKFHWGTFFEPYVRAVLINDQGRTYTQPFGFSVRILHVSKDGNDGQDGLSWETAFATLDKAIEVALERDMIWVARGTHTPATDYLGNPQPSDPRKRSFQLIKNLSIYGGFEGFETQVEQRDISANETILSGKLNDGSDAYHVLYNPQGLNLPSDANLDGFTISGGRADGSYPHSSGGGMHIASGNPTFKNIIFTDNEAEKGGAIYIAHESQPEFRKVQFHGNLATQGAAIYNNNSAPVFIHSSFSDNHAIQGGVFFNKESVPVITSSVIMNNTAEQGGFQYNENSSPYLIHLSISGNSASESGSLFHNTQSSNPKVKNSIIWGNDIRVPLVTNESLSKPVFQYSIVERSQDNSGWPAYLGTDGGNNIDADPLFLEFGDHPLLIYGVSPAVGAGNSNFTDHGTDIRGLRRPGLSSGLETAPDMGAYEYQQGIDVYSMRPIYVHSGKGSDNNDGMSWDTPFKSLEMALQAAGHNDTLWIAAGTYHPDREVGGSGNQFRTFQMQNHVAIFGGFLGIEDQLDQRDFKSNKTILDGMVGRREHAYNVFFHSDELQLDSTAVLDGFIITGGAAEGIPPRNSGGGMLNIGCNPTIRNTIFIENKAETGGGMFNDKASNPLLMGVSFIGNEATNGAGLYNNDFSAPVVINTSFVGNESGNEGGAIFNNQSSPVLVNVLISGNAAYQGGGMTNYLNSLPVLINCTLTGNLAYVRGGGIYNSWEAHPSILNSIIWGNMAGGSGNPGNQIANDLRSHASLFHSLYGNDPKDIFQGGGLEMDEQSLTGDPMFLEPVDATKAPVREGNLRLHFESPAIDAGDNSLLPHFVDTDLDGQTRILDGNNSGHGVIDLGAYEYASEMEPTNTEDLPMDNLLPRKFLLLPNYPNPFNPLTTIGFQVPEKSHIVIEVFDVTGRRVALLIDNTLPAGEYKTSFDASNYASGIYLYRIKTTDFSQTRKMLLLK